MDDPLTRDDICGLVTQAQSSAAKAELCSACASNCACRERIFSLLSVTKQLVDSHDCALDALDDARLTIDRWRPVVVQAMRVAKVETEFKQRRAWTAQHEAEIARLCALVARIDKESW